MTDINLNFMKIQKHMFLKDHQKKVKKGVDFYKNNSDLIDIVEKNLKLKKNFFYL